MKKIFIILLILFSIGSLTFYSLQPVFDSINFPENMYVTYDDIKQANSNNCYLPFKFFLPQNLTASNDTVSSTTLDIKLFGWLKIRRINIKLLNDTQVYTGGNTVGFYLTSDGVTVVGSNPIYTINGRYEPIKSSDIRDGDCITKINGIPITCIKDIDTILNNSTHPELAHLEIQRFDAKIEVDIAPALDLFTNRYKLGLWVENSVTGIGTLTYVKKSNLRFGSVGHQLAQNGVLSSNGGVYLCNYLGIRKGQINEPGEIQTSIKLSDMEIGEADTNCRFGVYGNIIDKTILNNSREISLGGRMSVELGDAVILCDVDGNGIKEYSVKIVKTNHQNMAGEKSIMLRVTDKTLLEKTGGIIQGMSGSPIIQNNKLIGAVTHVFLNDPAKAFGVYIDWMIEN